MLLSILGCVLGRVTAATEPDPASQKLAAAADITGGGLVPVNISRNRRRLPGRLASARPRAENGEMLLELLITVSIVTICVIGLVGALGSNFKFSAVSRQITNADQVLARYGEAIAAAPYEACGGPAPYAQLGNDAIPSADLPNNVTVGAPGGITDGPLAFALSVESVQYWNQDTAPATFATACPSSDRGVQMVMLRAVSGDGSLTRRTFIVKRAP